MKYKYKIIKGFDLVGDEEKSNTITHLIKELN